MAARPLIDQALLEKLERLTLHWQKSFPGLVGGRNASRFSGPGQEFLDHRHFHHGDDSAQSIGAPFCASRSCSSSCSRWSRASPCGYCSIPAPPWELGRDPKFDYARKLAAAMTYVGLVRLDTVCLQAFSSIAAGLM